jgi:hypothetical protein
MWKKKIEEGPFFRFKFYRMIYIFLKKLVTRAFQQNISICLILIRCRNIEF